MKKIKLGYNIKNIVKKIFTICFLFFIFLQINPVNAACNYTYKSFGTTCESLGSVDGAGSCFVDASTPSACRTTQVNCICCCDKQAKTDPKEPKANNDWTMPELQVKIPGLTFSDEIECENLGEKNEICESPWLGEYIAAIYRYAIGIIGILATITMMIGGIMWIVSGGNATTAGEAKAWIGASATGLILILCSYLILNTVNPKLVNFSPLGINTASMEPTTIAGISGFVNSGACKSQTSGSCDWHNFQSAFGSEAMAQQASSICNAESGNSSTCIKSPSYCVGPMQINLKYHWDKLGCSNLSNAFVIGESVKNSKGYSYKPYQVKPGYESAVNDCMQKACDPNIYPRVAKQIYNEAHGWGPWDTYSGKGGGNPPCKGAF